MQEISIIESILQYYPQVQTIYLFGSAAENQLRPDSDIDIAVLLPYHIAKNNDNLSMLPLRYALENKLKFDVDLINLRQVSTVMQYIVVNNGKIIYETDNIERKIFEMLVWSFYQKLNEERADILNHFFQTGKAYAV
jgi:uncharacterized protein